MQSDHQENLLFVKSLVDAQPAAKRVKLYAAIVAGKVPIAYPTAAVGLGDFSRGFLTKIESVFDTNEMPEEDRFVVLNAPYHAQLANDPSITQFYAATREPGIITESALPRMAGFDPIKAATLAQGNALANLFGFFGHRAGIVVASRPPVNLNEILPGAQQGSVITMTDAELGITWQLVQVIQQIQGFAQWQMQTLFGCGIGDSRGGLVGVSA